MSSSYVEEFVVRVEKRSENGKTLSISCLFNGALHCDAEPARLTFHPTTGKLWREEWMRNGALFRETGPAVTDWDPGGRTPHYQCWVGTGGIHRAGAPAEIFRDVETGNITEERFYWHGVEHNHVVHSAMNLKAQTGIIDTEVWRRYGKLTREGDFPAVVHRDPISGAVLLEEYWQDGRRHRENGPAIIEWRSGARRAIRRITHYLYGELVPAIDQPRP